MEALRKRSIICSGPKLAPEAFLLTAGGRNPCDKPVVAVFLHQSSHLLLLFLLPLTLVTLSSLFIFTIYLLFVLETRTRVAEYDLELLIILQPPGIAVLCHCIWLV